MCEVFAVGWQLWAAVWAVGLLFWERAVGWPLAESVVFGWVLWVVGDVGGIMVVGLVSDMLVGGWWEGALVGCGCGMVRCRFRIWCVMVAVGWRLGLCWLVVDGVVLFVWVVLVDVGG